MIIYVYYTESLDLFHFLVLSTFVVNLIQKPKPVLLKNQLARDIQSKTIKDLGAEPPVGGARGHAAHKPGSIGGPSPPIIKCFLNSSKFPTHYECLVQNRPDLKN